jgi:hypothetical protein
MSKVLVTGGRGFSDREVLFRVLDGIHNDTGITHLIHGAARGADSLAGQWARERGVQEVACPANWNVHGRRAGYLRNRAMAELQPELVVAFPGGIGTNMMVEMAEEHGIKVIDAGIY